MNEITKPKKKKGDYVPRSTRTDKRAEGTVDDKLACLEEYCRGLNLANVARKTGFSYNSITKWYKNQDPCDWDVEKARRIELALEKRGVAWAKQQRTLQNLRIKGMNVAASKSEKEVSFQDALAAIKTACDLERQLYEPSPTVRRSLMAGMQRPGGEAGILEMMEEMFVDPSGQGDTERS